MLIFILWVAVLIAVVTLYYRQIYSRFTAFGVKQQTPLPFFGNMFKGVFRIEHFSEQLNSMYNEFPEERFIGRFEFSKPILLVKDIELVKKITIKDFEHFLDHRGVVDEKVEPLFARNLFSLKGQDWKDMRSTLSPAFTSSKIKQMVPFMEEVGEMMIRVIKNKINDSESGLAEIDCKDLTSRYANDVIASCAFGLKVDSHTNKDNKFYEMGRNASTFKLKQMILLFLLSASPFLVKVLKLTLFSKEITNFFIDLVQSTMKNREKHKIIRPDMIHLLMEAKKGRLTHDVAHGKSDANVGFATVEESDVGKKTIHKAWSDNDLTAQAVLFFVAAFETISTVMSFSLYELAVHTDVQERLVKEIKEHNVKHGGKLDFTSIQNLTYLDMVVSEVLRLWPPALALDRVCVKDYNMGKPNNKATQDFIIRKGEILSIAAMSIHCDPQYFLNPKKFDPERFSEENRHHINLIAYMPFGLGPRNCIGSRFALCELKMLLYQTLLNFEISPTDKTCIPAKLSTDSFNLRLEGGHGLNFRSRGSIEIDCKDLTSRYANDVIASCAFGLKVDSHTDEDNKFYEMGRNVSTFKLKQMLLLSLFTASPFIAKVFKLTLFPKETSDFFIDLVQKTMMNREEHNIIRPDMIHLLMEAKKGRLTHDTDIANRKSDANVGFATVEESDVGKNKNHKAWSDIDLIAQAVIFFIAAFETISTVMSFTLYELAVNPDVQNRLVTEVKEHNVKHGGKLDFTSIQKLTYMDMVVSEVLRLWPPAMVLDRVCVKDYNMGKPNNKTNQDFIIRKGEILNIPTWSIHRDPLYFPNPMKFDPERFSEKNCHLINLIAYMPFGLGPRNCIGSRFALCELKVMVYQILLNFEVSPTEKTCFPPKLSADSFNIRLKGGHGLKFTSR